MKIIFCLWIILVVLIFQILSKNAQASLMETNYSVEVTTENGTKTYSTYDINEFSALTRIEALIKMSLLIGEVKNIRVLGADLDFNKLPLIQFRVIGSKGEKVVGLHTLDSRVGVLALQEAHHKNFSHLEMEIGGLKEIKVTDEFLEQEDLHVLLNQCPGLFAI